MPNPPHSTIDLNSADENTLVKKLNISHRLAKRIIALRPYQSLDQLSKIWGMDPQLPQRISPLVSFNQQTLVPDLAPKEISIPSEIGAPPETIEREQKTDFQSSRLEKDAGLDNKPEKAMDQPLSRPPAKTQASSWKVNLMLILILLAGAYFRFTGLNWDDNQHQHPDERYISMVAEQIRGVDGIAAYFDTENSTLNPLQFGSYTYGMFPLFFTRMVADWAKMSTYDAITLAGRAMSGLFDLIAFWILYFLGKRLYNKRVGFLAAALGVAAVLPIQLAHYFAVDSFSTIFVVTSFYFAIRAIPVNLAEEKITRSNLIYFGLFGFVVGLAGACKVNTLPVFGIIVLAGIAKIITDWKKPDFRTDLTIVLCGWVIAVFFTFLSFRVFQPYAFSGPGLLGIQLNQQWLTVLQEVVNQVAGNSDWPPNTHWTNRSFTFAWINMVTWGLGLPLGLAGWLGLGWAGVQIWKGEWRRHLLPFVWTVTYFIWQNIQFWRYMRYFLPIYPFIILFAAWALVEIYDRTHEGRSQLLANGFRFTQQFSNWRHTWKAIAGLAVLGIVLIGTYGYALAFTQIYNRPITRIVASEWMLANFSGPFNVIVESPPGNRSYPVAISTHQVILPGDGGSADINVLQDGSISTITTTYIRQIGVSIYFRLTKDQEGTDIITEGRLSIDDDIQDGKQEISFDDITLTPGETYYFHYKIHNSSQFSLSNVTLQNVDQDKGFTIPINLNLESQAPGMYEDSFSLQPETPLTLNRLVIVNFHQVFVPTETTLKVGIYKKDTDSPLVETTQSFTFSQPGIQLSPTFVFSPIEVSGNQIYQVRYEITNGAPLHLFGEKFTLETSWDDALPLNISPYEAQGGIYSPLNLELYEPDTPEKREAMIKILSESNYIVIPSNRAYDAMPRLPLRYPLTLKYYQTLFDCNCNGDALENHAYALKPPFKSPLGFELVATFENPPSLGFLTFPDQSADESFTVYDHPKVFVFKKSQDFSIDRVSTILNSVNLDEVIFQTPKQFTQVPTAMQLPADRLLAQTNGGSWSAMFNRNSLLNTNDVIGGLAWYLLLFFIGWIVFPFVFKVFSGLPDRGYPLIRMAGLILTTWLAWFLGSIKVSPFSQLTLWLYVGVIIILSSMSAYRQRDTLSKYFQSHWKYILGIEVIFLAIFLFSLRIRLGNPDLWHPWFGGEKPMDFAFFNAVLKSVYFPPEHPWFSGHYINYYYYGYIIAAIPTKLLGILPSIAYNLILPSWFAMTGVGLFCISFNLVAGLHKTLEQRGLQPIGEIPSFWMRLVNGNLFARSFPYLAGTFALISVLFLGNLYEVRVLWKYLPDAVVSGSTTSSFVEHAGAFVGGAIQVWTGSSNLPGDNGGWYFEASRPILHDGPDTPIAEFPYFTFLYGDMHPHLLIMPFYALALGWMIGLLRRPISNEKRIDQIFILITAGLVFGVFRASHTWDFPTFLGLGGLAIAWNTWSTKTSPVQKTFQLIFIHEVAFVGIVIAFYWPFAEWFKTEYVSLEFWKGLRTPLIDYLFVFGIPIFVAITLLIQDFKPNIQSVWHGIHRLFTPGPLFSASSGKQGNLKSLNPLIFTSIKALINWQHLRGYAIAVAIVYTLRALWVGDYQVVAFGLPVLIGIAYIILFNHELPLLRKVTWILFVVGFSVTLFVEVFVLRGDIGRSNTVFRFYNQAWIFLGLAISLALVDLLNELTYWQRSIKVSWSLVLGILVLCAASYPLIATGKKIADRWPDIQNPPHSLDGSIFMLGNANDPNTQNPAIYNDEDRLINLSLDYVAILYMQDNVKGSPVIVEGHTEEYRWGSRFSIYTGLPSVVGWSWHVRQHNSLLDSAMVDDRINDVNNFYNTEDVQSANQFLEKYGVRYIILGDLERGYYESNGIEKFIQMVKQGMLQIVFGDNSPETTTIFEVVNAK